MAEVEIWRWDGNGNMAIKRTAGVRGVFEKRYDWKVLKTKRGVEAQKVMSEKWRARRRAQEKSWEMDGWDIVDESNVNCVSCQWPYHFFVMLADCLQWVSGFGDPRDGLLDDSLTAEDAEEEEEEQGKEEGERKWQRRRNRWGFLVGLTGKMAEEDELEEEEGRARREERNKWRN